MAQKKAPKKQNALRLRGYTPIKGDSARRYRTPGGKIISRREYDNKRLKKLGWNNRSEAEKFRTSRFYTQKRARLEANGRVPDEVSIFTEFAAFVRDIDWGLVDRLYADVDAMRKAGIPEDVINDPNGVLAEALVLEGARLPDWEWAVGDTPKGKVATV